MIYRRGELSPAMIDRGWPHQVALPARACEQGGYKAIRAFCTDLSLCSPGHSVFHDRDWFNVYCFAEPADAKKFLTRFGGEAFDPKQRGRSWAIFQRSIADVTAVSDQGVEEENPTDRLSMAVMRLRLKFNLPGAAIKDV